MTRAALTRAAFTAIVVLTLGAGTLTLMPSLHEGLYADDYVAVAMMEGKLAAPRHPLDLFNFANGTKHDVEELKRLGSLPWWTPSNFRVSFMRPLSSALWHFDRMLFGNRLPLYHLHSLLAFALLTSMAALCYRRFLSMPVAALATIVFALDNAHHFPVVWLSNRGGIYALALGLLGLYAHVRAREDHRKPFAWLAVACFGSALLFGEWAFPTFGYVLAYELVRGPGTVARRARALLPIAALGVTFLLTRDALEYGARGSGAYVDPGGEPVRFLLEGIGRIPVFITDMVFNVPSSQWDHGSPLREVVLRLELFSPHDWAKLPPWRFFHAIFGAFACLLLAWLVRVSLRAAPPDERRSIAVLVVGSLASLIPVVGSFPSSRLTVAAYFGVAAIFACTLRELGRALVRARSKLGFALAYAAIVFIVNFHVVQPMLAPIGPMIDQHAVTRHWVLRAPIDRKHGGVQDVYLLSAAEFTTTFFFAYIWSAHGLPMPRSVVPIVVAPLPLDVLRISDHSLRIQALGGSFLTSGQEQMFRPLELTVREGQRFRAGHMRVTVLKERDGRAQMLRADFDRSLDDPRTVLLTAGSEGYERFEPPRLGKSERIKRAAFPSWTGLERARLISRIGLEPAVLTYSPVPTVLAFDPDPERRP